MNLHQRIQNLVDLGVKMSNYDDPVLQATLHRAETENPWFTRQNLEASLRAVSTEFLTEKNLQHMVSRYRLDDNILPKRVGIIMAGNIPLVGFHDLMCCYLAGHRVMVKFSDKDTVMMQWAVNILSAPSGSEDLVTVDGVLRDYDAVIATGSNASAAQFRHYFAHVPHLIRQNRNSVAILRGNETQEQLNRLGSDVFSYFGLGCRNVSHLCIPESYDVTVLFAAFEGYRDVMHHHKYKNNYDYNLAVYLLNKEPFLQNDFLILRESEQIISRISVLHYHRYASTEDVENWLSVRKDEIQCVVSQSPVTGFEYTPFGQAQCPAIDTYADGVDTMQFLLAV